MRRVCILAGATILFWAVLIYPAWLLTDDSVWLYSATAMGLCLVPAAITLWWSARAAAGAPERQLVALLGGTGIRLAVVLGVGMALTLGLPDLFSKAFLVWLLAFYLFTLFVEVRLLLPAREKDAMSGRG